MSQKMSWSKLSGSVSKPLIVVSAIGWLAGVAMNIIDTNETEERLERIEDKLGIDHDSED